MANMRITAWFASLLLILGGAVLAQPDVPPLPADVDLSQPLTLEACVQVALAANPQLAVAGEQVRQARNSVTQARAQGLPQLSAIGQVSASGGRPFGAGSGLSSTPSTTSQVGVRLYESFFESGRAQQIRATEAQVAGQRHALMDTRRSLILAVAQDYYVALAAQELVGVADRAVQASTQHLEAAEARIAAGATAPADRYPFDVELQQAVVSLIQARNQARVTLNFLKQTMGLPAESPLQLADQLSRPPLPGDLETLRHQAYLQRPDILRQKALVEAARLQREVARLQQGPLISVSASNSLGFTNGRGGDGWEGQIGVSLPLFDSGASRAAADSADAALRIATENLRQIELAASREVENSYLDVMASHAQIDAAQTALRAAQVNAEAAQERYQAGVGTVLDVTDAEQRLRRAESDLVAAFYNYNTSLIALQAAVGVPEIPAATS